MVDANGREVDDAPHALALACLEQRGGAELMGSPCVVHRPVLQHTDAIDHRINAANRCGPVLRPDCLRHVKPHPLDIRRVATVSASSAHSPDVMTARAQAGKDARSDKAGGASSQNVHGVAPFRPVQPNATSVRLVPTTQGPRIEVLREMAPLGSSRVIPPSITACLDVRPLMQHPAVARDHHGRDAGARTAHRALQPGEAFGACTGGTWMLVQRHPPPSPWDLYQTKPKALLRNPAGSGLMMTAAPMMPHCGAAARPAPAGKGAETRIKKSGMARSLGKHAARQSVQRTCIAGGRAHCRAAGERGWCRSPIRLECGQPSWCLPRSATVLSSR